MGALAAAKAPGRTPATVAAGALGLGMARVALGAAPASWRGRLASAPPMTGNPTRWREAVPKAVPVPVLAVAGVPVLHLTVAGFIPTKVREVPQGF